MESGWNHGNSCYEKFSDEQILKRLELKETFNNLKKTFKLKVEKK